MQSADPAEHDRGAGFSLVAGGPLHRLLRSIGLARVDAVYVWRPAVAVLVVAWLPLLLFGLAEYPITRRWDPILTDPAVAARFWLGAPLLFVAEGALHLRCARAIERFLQSELAGQATSALVERAVRRARALRDLRVVEIGLLVVAAVAGLAALWGVTDVSAVVSGPVQGHSMTITRIWYAVVSLPLFQFLLARWLWRWVIWSLVLLDFARARLQLAPMHPDRAGGLEMLSDPTFAFGCFAAANSAVLSAWCAAQLATGTVKLAMFAPKFALLLVTAVFLAFAPLIVFCRDMIHARHEGLRDYGLLALHYTRLFRQRWIERKPDDALLGSSDIQSMADMQNSYQSMALMRVLPFGPRALITVALGVALPLLPLVTYEIPIGELLYDIGKAMVVGLPG